MIQMHSKSIPIYRDLFLSVDYYASPCSNGNLAFTWSPLGEPSKMTLDGYGFAGSLLLKHGYDLVAFKCTRNHWYQDVVDKILDDINETVHGMGHRRRVAYGSSMGAYAAIRFSGQLMFNQVLALAPQVDLYLDGDERWRRHALNIPKFEALCSFHFVQSCLYDIFYDPFDRDALHASLLRHYLEGFSNKRLVALPFVGHAIPTFFDEIGYLKRFAIEVLDGGDIDRPYIRESRIKSITYLKNILDRLNRRRDKQMMSRIIDSLGCQSELDLSKISNLIDRYNV